MKFRHDRMSVKELLRLQRMNDLILDQNYLTRGYNTATTYELKEILKKNYPFPSIYLKETETGLIAKKSARLISFLFNTINNDNSINEEDKKSILNKPFIIYIAYDIENDIEEERFDILQEL